MKLIIKLILLILVIVTTILLTAQNMEQAELRLFSPNYIVKISVSILIFICLFVGIFVGVASCFVHYQRKIRHLKNNLRKVELEKKSLQQQLSAINAEKNGLQQLKEIR